MTTKKELIDILKEFLETCYVSKCNDWAIYLDGTCDGEEYYCEKHKNKVTGCYGHSYGGEIEEAVRAVKAIKSFK